MTDLERLIDLYGQDARVNSLAQALSADPARIEAAGLAGSGKSFVLTGLMLQGTGPWLVVEPDKEAAAYLQNTLSSIYPDADVMFIPDSFKRPGFLEEIINSQVMERTEALNRLHQNSHNPTRKAAIIAARATKYRDAVAPGLKLEGSEVSMIPSNRVHLDEGKASSMLKLMSSLEDNDDVSNVYANFDIDDDVMERLSA